MAELDWAVVAATSAALSVLAWRGDPRRRLRPTGTSPPADTLGRGRLRASLAVGASGLLLALGIGWWAVPAAGALGLASFLVLGRLRTGEAERRSRGLVAQLPQACDLMAVCVESGLPPRSAARVVGDAVGGPLGQALAELSATIDLGAPESHAWAQFGAADPVLAPLGREMSRAVDSGVGLARTLRALGVDARRDAASAAEVAARRVGVRSVLPLMVCFLPAFLLLGVVPIIGGVAQHLFR